MDVKQIRNRLAIDSNIPDIDAVMTRTNQDDTHDEFFECHTLPYRLETKIVRLLRKNRLIYGSDATFKDGYGAFAWGILDKSNPKAPLLKSHAPLHGVPDQNHSTRGELFGLLGCMRHILYMQKIYKFNVKKKIRIYIYTDSSSSISIIKKKFSISSINCVENDSDIKAEVRHAYKRIKDFVEVCHVHSHQDDKIDYNRLSLESKLNVLMDRFAAKALLSKTKIKHRHVIPHLPRQKVSFRSPHERLTRNVILEINRAKIGHQAEQYLQGRWSFGTSDMLQVHWTELGTAINSVPFYKKVQYSRILHKQWPTMKRNMEWKCSQTDKCPICMSCVEDRSHVLQCHDPLAQTYRDTAMLSLRDELYKIQSSPFLISHVLRLIRQYHARQPIQMLTEDDFLDEEQCYVPLINKVASYGVDNLLSAVVTQHLTTIQDEYIRDTGLSNSINIIGWTRGFIRLILEYTHGIWMYRCSILHNKDDLSRDTLVRQQAVELLYQLRRNPYRLHYGSRDLLTRKKSQLLTSSLSSVLNWIDRVSVAIDRQTQNSKLGVSDIRYWLNGKTPYGKPLAQFGDTKYIMPGCTVEYDSDDTLTYEERFPDENTEAATWTCEKNCCDQKNLHGRFSLSDRFNCLPCLHAFMNISFLPSINPT